MSAQELRFCGGMMYDQLIRAQASAAEIACAQMSPARLKALHESLREACQLPAGAGWDQKAAAHAAFFTVLAEAAGDPVVAPILLSGGELAYELMMTAGCAANGIVTNSRRRFLEVLRVGDAEGAALELEEHLRILHLMCRLASGPRGLPRSRDMRALTESNEN
jgi:DNA-binding GntR family transcriptional regulator